MLYINSYAALIFRAAVINKYMVCNRHVLILQYFIVEYQQNYQLYSDSFIWKYTICSIGYLIQHLNFQTLRETGEAQYAFDLKEELHLQLEQKCVIQKSCSGKHEMELFHCKLYASSVDFGVSHRSTSQPQIYCLYQFSIYHRYIPH